jgi:hypothetical protein
VLTHELSAGHSPVEALAAFGTRREARVGWVRRRTGSACPRSYEILPFAKRVQPSTKRIISRCSRSREDPIDRHHGRPRSDVKASDSADKSRMFQRIFQRGIETARIACAALEPHALSARNL